VATSRVYDPEAEDIFGSDFFAFQVHVSYRIIVESSNQSLYLEIIQEIVEEGFDIVSNGQRQFRSSLHTNQLFLSVISVKTRSGLTPPVEPPTSKPTRSPTYRPTRSPTDKPSKKPTTSPTVKPTDQPTGKPSKNPTQNPSMTPSFSPSVSPSTMPSNGPSELPSLNPSEKPSNIPSLFPSCDPSTSPSASPSASPSTATTPDSTQYTTHSRFLVNNGAVIAGIVGTSVLFISVCLLITLFCYKYRKKKPRERYPFPTEVALSQNIHGSYVPGIVELGDEQQSLADTTLGDQEAGLIWKQRKYNSSQQAIQPLGSFDENSLYTTPFEVDEEEYRATIMPVPTVRTHSSLSLMTPLEYEDRVVFPSSGSTTDESSEEDVEFPLSLKGNKDSPMGTVGTASTTTNTSIPVDVDSNEPYYDDLKITKIEPLDSRSSDVLENEDFIRNPSDLDVWSCDFEDFDRGSDFYRGEESSRSTSLSSSASTHQINNGTPAIILSKGVRSLDTIKDDVTLSTPSTVLQSKVGENPNALVAADGIEKDNEKLTPSSPESSKASRSSSKKSTISNLSRKAKTGTDEYRPHHNSRDGKNNDARSGGLVSPLTKLFESMSIPAVTPEGNESEHSGRTGSKSGSLREVSKSSGAVISDDDDSGMSASPWLLEEIENTLGPKSVNADISSLSGKSSIRSNHSKSKRQPNNGTRRNGSEASFGSSNSRFSHHDVASIMSAVSSSMSTTDILLDQQPEQISYSTSRSTLEDGIKRLEMQLLALDQDQDNIEDSTSSVTMSSITGASFTTSISARSRHTTGRSTKGRRVLVLVPSGKLGVILTDNHDGKGTVINSIKNGSPVDGILKQGDKLIAVDDVKVEKLSCSQITSLIASRADRERRFTVITNSFNQSADF
jgi:hypothetical protein